jgi:hypothetical protein
MTEYCYDHRCQGCSAPESECDRGIKCYACDSMTAFWSRDLRTQGGDIESACSKHSDPAPAQQSETAFVK